MVKRIWLIELREKKSYSQSEVAKQSGIVQQSYQLIEIGKNTPRPETAKRIGAVLDFPWTRFYSEVNKNDNVDAFEEAAK